MGELARCIEKDSYFPKKEVLPHNILKYVLNLPNVDYPWVKAKILKIQRKYSYIYNVTKSFTLLSINILNYLFLYSLTLFLNIK